MTDVGATIAPKSDQMNADDLIQGPRTIRITKVSANPGSAEQPISIFFEGDNGKPYKPCKSMRRLLVMVWGTKGDAYAGREMTLYRDSKVMFGGVEVGGIRVSHMSHIDSPQTVTLTASKTSRKPYTVQPLAKSAPKPAEAPAKSLQDRAGDAKSALKGANTLVGLDKAWRAGEALRRDLKEAGEEALLDELTLTFEGRKSDLEASHG